MIKNRIKTGEKSYKLQSVAEPYTMFVLEKLVNIKGTSVSDVISFVLKQWIGEHSKELAEYGITFEKAIKEGYLK